MKSLSLEEDKNIEANIIKNEGIPFRLKKRKETNEL